MSKAKEHGWKQANGWGVKKHHIYRREGIVQWNDL